jgi:excisionase family DNA binding protein
MSAPRYLTVQEVAELARCEHRSVRRAINAGRLRAFRPTRKILVREDDARTWIESRRAVGFAARPQRHTTRSTSASAVGSVARLQAIEGRSG